MTYDLLVDIARPLLSNHRLHHMEKARQVKEWREAGCVMARAAKIPPLVSVHVASHGIYPTRRLPDLDATSPCLKAILDGIVDAHVIEDDRWPFVRSVLYEEHEVVRGCRPGLVVSLTKVDR